MLGRRVTIIGEPMHGDVGRIRFRKGSDAETV